MIDIWIHDTDDYSHTVTRISAMVTRASDFSICSKSAAAFRELSDYLRMAADELERGQRG
ncbi:MAG TPA: hypothetical protein VGJ59_01960 [Jatrophihabitantaceae bacterium]